MANLKRLGLTLIVPILLTFINLTRPVLCKITNVPVSRYATTGRNFGTLTGGDFDAFSGRQLPEASEQSFIFRPWRQSNFTINVTVPVAALVIPDRGLYTPTKDVANQAIMLIFGGLTLLAMFAVPLLMTGTRPDPSIIDDSENEIATNRKVERIMSSTRNFNYMDADLQNLIGLNPKSCLEKTICEAHREPEVYGLLSLPFLIMFPPLANVTITRNVSYAPYREAATKGARSFSKPCDEQYHCYFDIMDLTQYFVDWYKQVMQIPPPEAAEYSSVSPGVVISKKNKLKIRKTSKILDPTWTSPDESQSRQAFLERRIFNVSVPTFTPMFDFLLPDMSSKGSPLELTNQVIIGAFVFITYIATIFEPMLLSNARPLGLTARDADGAAADLNRGFFSNLLSPKTIYFEDSHRNISTKLGIDPSECLQKCICQAHRHTETYGLLSSLLRVVYPAPPSSMTNATTTSAMSANQIAAFRGASGKADCDDIYHCFFDPLDLTLLVFNWWKSSRDPDQMPLIL